LRPRRQKLSGADPSGEIIDKTVKTTSMEPIGVIVAIPQKVIGQRQSIEHKSCAFVVTHLPFRQEHHNWPTQAIANHVKFGVQALPGR
jgi:hypothetical protein